MPLPDWILAEEKRLCEAYGVSTIDEVLAVQEKMLRN